MPYKDATADEAEPVLKYLAEKMPPAEMAKLQAYIREEKTFETMQRYELAELLNGTITDINTRLSYDKVKEIVIAAQKGAGMQPYVWAPDNKEDPAKHVKTPFEKFIDHCHAFQTDGKYNHAKPINFRTFSLVFLAKKDVERQFDEYCKKNKPTDDEAKAVRKVLDEVCEKLPVAYGEVFVQRLKRELYFWKATAANTKAMTDMAFKNKKPSDGTQSTVRQPMKL
ncbi:MAG: hypothetical protein WCT52_04345 [Candidatus Micrarchaeia archaeon]|jgi:hypothetical protein